MPSYAKKLRFSTHHTIKKVTEDIEDRMQFNTAIAAIMEHLNNITSFQCDENSEKIVQAVYYESVAVIPKLLQPFAPHLSEEIWAMLRNQTSILEAPWIEYNDTFLIQDEVTYVIQINGKLRSKIVVGLDTLKDEIEKIALADEKIMKYTEGKKIIKVIIIPKKLVNIVIK